jgi:dethiobiotin synthetase
MTAVFVTGSGTEIGKTFVTAALVHEFRRRGRRIEALKPVASGFDSADIANSDSGVLLDAMGETPTVAALDRISPWRFCAPLSPDMAAQREGRAIDFVTLIEHSRAAIADNDLLLIEGVGGVMVPLNDENTVLDWMEALPVILIGGSYLGAISHTLTAIDTLRARDLKLAALVINETLDSTVALDETASTVARFVDGSPVLTLPRLAGPDRAHPTIATLTDLLAAF